MKEIIALEDRIIRKSAELSALVGKLGILVAKKTGVNLNVDLCNGYEIEFRRINENGTVDDYSCLRNEDIEALIKRRNKYGKEV